MFPDFFKTPTDWYDFFYEHKEMLGQTEEKFFKPFYNTSYEDISVIILTDTEENNTGIPYECNLGSYFSLPLQNMYTELKGEGYFPTMDGNLYSWNKQNVMLLNDDRSEILNIILKKLNTRKDIVYVLLGNSKRNFSNALYYPDPKTKEFIGCNMFYEINNKLLELNKKTISW